MNTLLIAKTLELVNRGYGSRELKNYLKMHFGIQDDVWQEIKRFLEGKGVQIKDAGIGKAIQKKQYYELNKTKIRMYYRRYYVTHKDKFREYYRKYREAYKDKIKEYINAWKQANQEHLKRV